jgi:nitroimidazol reductase NimA-like FMN-containing flavoprotein (pyridoxamine 5'-phosphate oxidase superfamily)
MDDEAALASAQAIIDSNSYMTLATADQAGAPWASPVWFAHRGLTEFLWVSRPEARHSRNIAVRPEVGIVIFDSSVRVGDAQAVYLEGRAAMVNGDELQRMIAIYSDRSTAQGAPAWTTRDVDPHAPHRLYVARASAAYILADGDRRLPLRLDGLDAPG